MTTKKVIDDGRDFIFPIFKFQKQCHADLMWQNGNIHLSSMKSFRDGTYGGLIDDDREGQVTLHFPTDHISNYQIIHEQQEISLDDFFIYCGSSDFFSDTLHWSISDGKETCVLITDFNEVVGKISDAIPELEYIGSQACDYVGRDIGALNFRDTRREQMLHNNAMAAWIKPHKYAPQKEFRAVWKAKGKLSSEKHINKDIGIQDFLIPVSYLGVDLLFSDNKPHTVGAKVVTVDGKNDAWFDIHYPLETFTPVIHKYGDHYLLGFFSPNSNVSEASFHGGQIGITATDDGLIGCNVFLQDILRIEYRVNA
ncbi:hypothetical protein [Halopseudomonas laoshanensis]|uniref:hypothetical protein n=1 Tax=Halopseudomonas laoshanensis TaxID=2268758 RepID=UPI003735E241